MEAGVYPLQIRNKGQKGFHAQEPYRVPLSFKDMKDELQESGNLASLPRNVIGPPPHPRHWAAPNSNGTFLQNRKMYLSSSRCNPWTAWLSSTCCISALDTSLLSSLYSKNPAQLFIEAVWSKHMTYVPLFPHLQKTNNTSCPTWVVYVNSFTFLLWKIMYKQKSGWNKCAMPQGYFRGKWNDAREGTLQSLGTKLM